MLRVLFQKKQKVRKCMNIERHKSNNDLFISEVTSGASYEANKEAAKNDNLSAGTRVSHGVDAVKDKGMSIYLTGRKSFLSSI